jgi:hypothetical protein
MFPPDDLFEVRESLRKHNECVSLHRADVAAPGQLSKAHLNAKERSQNDSR